MSMELIALTVVGGLIGLWLIKKALKFTLFFGAVGTALYFLAPYASSF